MTIERDLGIRFHELGTLTSVTKWIRTHDEGLAEWFKNARRAYLSDRANVAEEHRTAVLLSRDATSDDPARIALLDVGGATLDDVERWSVWQDPGASGRGSGLAEEETQGNGGKAYMYRLFEGESRILGVKDKKLNCKGFSGPKNSLERGVPGFMPDIVSGKQLPIQSWEHELRKALNPYDVSFEELPDEVQRALKERESFTLVEGLNPIGFYRDRIDANDLVQRILWHEQTTLAIQQIRFYAFHNGRELNNGKPLELEPIAPYAGYPTPLVYEIPEDLPDEKCNIQSTTLSGTRPKGRLILYTSNENMYTTYKRLKPRWKITYRTQHQMIGSKGITEIVPQTPGSHFIYATLELSALEPDYVEPGRRRPLPGPLLEAIDLFAAEKIRALAKEINDQRRQDFDNNALDEVQKENRILDNFKNQFLPTGGPGGEGGPGEEGEGPDKKKKTRTETEYGEIPDSIELAWDFENTFRIGKGVKLCVDPIFRARVIDSVGRLVPNRQIEWYSGDRHIAKFEDHNRVVAIGKGKTEICAKVKGTSIESPKIGIDVWAVDHVLLTPRTLEVAVGTRKQILAEVTNDEGYRATDIFLNWEHDAADPLIVRISPTGWVMGNRIGRTTISAGAGDPAHGGVWARIRVEASVIPNPKEIERGGGFPQLRLTGRDTDPFTGDVRQGDPEAPSLWQEVYDYQNNIWWLNLENPEAAFYFRQRIENIVMWRAFHCQKVVDMVIQVHMKEEYDAKGDAERPDLWSRHKLTLDTYEILYTQAMWNKLKDYVVTGARLEQG